LLELRPRSQAQSLLQEVCEAAFIARGNLRKGGPFAGQACDLELIAHLGDSLVLQVHAATPSNAS
jgi:hypothetical protein